MGGTPITLQAGAAVTALTYTDEAGSIVITILLPRHTQGMTVFTEAGVPVTLLFREAPTVLTSLDETGATIVTTLSPLVAQGSTDFFCWWNTSHVDSGLSTNGAYINRSVGLVCCHNYQSVR